MVDDERWIIAGFSCLNVSSRFTVICWFRPSKGNFHPYSMGVLEIKRNHQT
jgi:hypothetical protein